MFLICKKFEATRINAFINYGDIAISGISYSNQCMQHPMIHLKKSFRIKNSNFYKVASNIVYGTGEYIQKFSFTNCAFADSIQVIHLSRLSKIISNEDFRIRLDINASLSNFEKCTFMSISSTDQNDNTNGGSIYCYKYGTSFQNCLFVENVAKNGGCGYFVDSDVVFTKSNFSMNKAVQSGGALYLAESKFLITDCFFVDNQAEVNAGVAYIDGSRNSTFEESTFCRNRAAFYSAGIEAKDSHVKFSSCKFIGHRVDTSNRPTSTSISLVSSHTVLYSCSFESVGKSKKNHLASDSLSTYQIKACCFDSLEDTADSLVEGEINNQGGNVFGGSCNCLDIPVQHPYEVDNIQIVIGNKSLSRSFTATALSFIIASSLIGFYMVKTDSSVDSRHQPLNQ